MNKLIPILLLVLLTTTSSCIQNWSCKCDMTETDESGNQISNYTSYHESEIMGKKKAKKECEERSTSTVYESYSMGNITRKIDCSLER